MRRLAVIHHRHAEWVSALKAAEPRLDIRGWHPREALAADGAWLEGAEALFTWKFPDGFLNAMPRLRWIQNGGAGVDHLVGNPAIPPEVILTRCDGRFGYWMARYVVGHLLAEAQRLEDVREAQGARRWNGQLLPEDLFGALAVVVGFGRIGRQIGRALRELGLVVEGIVHAAREDGEFPLSGPDRLPFLLPHARLLVLCAPLTPNTRGMISGRLLAHGHSGLLLINVGRGELMDSEALMVALERGDVGHAVLDVFAQEPLPVDSPLWGHPRITITPHHAGPSRPEAMIPELQENLRRYAEGKPLVDAVDRTRGY